MENPAKAVGGQLGTYAYAERTAGQIVKDIVENAQEIIRSEVRLAKAEIREESRKMMHAGMVLVVGAVIGLYGLGFLFAAASSALALAMPQWAASLIVGGVLGIGGAIGLAVGIERWRQIPKTPEKTIADVKENVEWLKSQTKY